VHPFVCGWWAIDHDGRMFLYREIFMTGRTVATHARQINELTTESISKTICDHDAGDRQTLVENGIPNIAAKKSVSQGIDAVQDRLKITDGQARVFFLRDSLVEVDQTLKAKLLPTKTTDEFGGYIWNDRLTKEAPIKKEDDGMDMTRYAIMSEDGDYSQPPAGLIINDIPLRSFIPKRERLTR